MDRGNRCSRGLTRGINAFAQQVVSEPKVDLGWIRGEASLQDLKISYTIRLGTPIAQGRAKYVRERRHGSHDDETGCPREDHGRQRKERYGSPPPPPPPRNDRTAGRFVTSSTRWERGVQVGRGRGKGIVTSPMPGPVTIVADFPIALLREVDVDSEEHVNDDDYSHVEEEEDEEADLEQEGDDLFLQNHASEADIPRKVVRDGRGRYVPCSDGSSSTGRKKMKRDLSWRLTSPVLGGPSHINVLGSFGGHIAFSSWTQPEKVRSWLKCYERSGSLEARNDIKLPDAVVQRFLESGLGHLRRCMTIGLDENLISAFVERCQPDNNTFHKPFGEISIMLHDVQRILGILVNGRRVFVEGMVEAEEEEGRTREDESLKAKVANFFGVPVEEVAPPLYKGGGLLTQRLRRVVESGNQHDSHMAYMMMLLGQTLFMDKSCDRVIARMLPLFNDLSGDGEYAWGVATLVYLYRQLGMASRLSSRGLSGCFPLLQAWIYEFKGENCLLEEHRQRFDGLRAEHIAWTPNGYRPDRSCRTTLYSGLIRFLDIVEPYQPNRCMRQFEYSQAISMSMVVPATEHRPASPKSGYRVYFGEFPNEQWGLVEARIVLQERSLPVVMAFETRPRQPTTEARGMYIGRLVREMEQYFKIDDDDDGIHDNGVSGR
ncbi:hypothetical protein RND81_08G110400 [Saponaria officinalis]|uniref:Aminotransferase-like plant mobile domain-containing protein n=1 Tax=Saponaria officinalis TaxID=3572 RepID=A0AAW1J7S3_SAPOF